MRRQILLLSRLGWMKKLQPRFAVLNYRPPKCPVTVTPIRAAQSLQSADCILMLLQSRQWHSFTLRPHSFWRHSAFMAVLMWEGPCVQIVIQAVMYMDGVEKYFFLKDIKIQADIRNNLLGKRRCSNLWNYHLYCNKQKGKHIGPFLMRVGRVDLHHTKRS